MYLYQHLPIAAIVTTLLFGPPTPQQPSACSLLTEAQVNAALEIKTLPGKPPVPNFTKLCIWSDDPNGAISNRRVSLALTSRTAFDLPKGNNRIKTEPVSGIGDEAYYQSFGSDSPLLAVRKGGSAFTVRILNGLKLKPFTLAEEKAKEADLAKAAVTKL
jgi:hypothetical protein